MNHEMRFQLMRLFLLVQVHKVTIMAYVHGLKIGRFIGSLWNLNAVSCGLYRFSNFPPVVGILETS